MRASIDVRFEPGEGDRPLFLAAIAVLITALLSGPLGLLVTMIDGQPAWSDGRTFIDHFRWWHQAPFWFGFAFIASWVALNARLAALADHGRRTAALAMLVATSIYGSMIALNYVLQVAFVPLAVAAGDPNVAYATMANPSSIGWALEMFGYGALGVANWLSADLFPGGGRRRQWIAWLMYANALISGVGAVLTAIDVRWVFTLPGIGSYLGWNALVVLTAAVIAIEYRPR